MEKFSFEDADFYVDAQILREDSEGVSVRNFFEYWTRFLFKDTPKFKEYLDNYGNINGLNKYALLCIHGASNNGWFYIDGNKSYSMQSWIDWADGEYSALVLAVCNSGAYTPKSKKSILFVPDKIIYGGKGLEDSPVFSLIVPGIGEIDSYTIDYELEELKKCIKK